MFKTKLLIGTALLAMAFTPQTAMATISEDVDNLFPLEGFYVNARYRYEYVDQDNALKNATASTIRTNIGYETNSLYNFSAGIEVEHVGTIGEDNYNSSVNGKTTYSVIADPTGVELNHLWLAYDGIPETKIKIGRQPFNLDNQRFIGTVGWRQNDQSYDAVMVSNNSIPDLDLMYAYVGNINRINGDEHALGDLDTKSHIAHAAYKFSNWFNLVGYGYWLDIKLIPTASSKTLGLRLTGKGPINDDWKFFYEAEMAEQDDYGNNTNSYDATYYRLSPGVNWNNWTLQAGYESMEGDGTTTFSTPLATLHGQNGWADQFLNLRNLANGLEDASVKVGYKFDGMNDWLDSTKVVAIYHDYQAERGGSNYGDEWNLDITRPVNIDDEGWSEGAMIRFKYANYDADNFSVDTEKFWVEFSVKF